MRSTEYWSTPRTGEKDANLRIITAKDPEGLEIIRHSCAHLLAQAVKQLFPEAQVTIGPVIEDGFYYDFAYDPGFSEDDLARIEKDAGAGKKRRHGGKAHHEPPEQ